MLTDLTLTLLLASVELLEWVGLHPRLLICCARVKLLLKPLGIHAAVIVQDMSIPLRHHGCLRVARITLDTLDVTAAQHELVSGADVPKLVEAENEGILVEVENGT